MKERTLRSRATEVVSFVKGKVNANELRMPAIRHFVEKVRGGFLDDHLLKHDATSSWMEEPFIQRSIGSILRGTRTYAITSSAEVGKGPNGQDEEQIEEEVERRVLKRLNVKRIARSTKSQRTCIVKEESVEQACERWKRKRRARRQ